MLVYPIYAGDRFYPFRISLLNVISEIQVYGRNLKLATFSQLCGCNIWRIFLDSTYLCILLAPHKTRG